MTSMPAIGDKIKKAISQCQVSLSAVALSEGDIDSLNDVPLHGPYTGVTDKNVRSIMSNVRVKTGYPLIVLGNRS